MEGVKLSSKEQAFFANVCSVLRMWLYQQMSPGVNQGKGTEPFDKLLLGQLSDILDRFNLSPQDLDRLYDIMHRTGANK